MIYTFKVRAPGDRADPLETVHHAHGVDVLDQARALIDRHPDCDGVQVLLLETQLFYLERRAVGSSAA
jgi:hypothetical protein